MENDDEYLLISGIKHFKFCRRRWALIHIEQHWEENALTVSGHLMHENVHDIGFTEKRGRIVLSRGMPARSDKLHIQGICDLVELIRDDEFGVGIQGREGKYRIYPVEYKKGKPDINDADLWHLCAEALCLEDMFLTSIPEGSVYYGELHKRIQYSLTEALRCEVISAISEMNDLLKRSYTPKVKAQKACHGCSLFEVCMPRLNEQGSVKDYIERALRD